MPLWAVMKLCEADPAGVRGTPEGGTIAETEAPRRLTTDCVLQSQGHAECLLSYHTELSTAELGAIYSAPDFSDFVELSSKIVERALTDSYDFMKDYRADGGDVE